MEGGRQGIALDTEPEAEGPTTMNDNRRKQIRELLGKATDAVTAIQEILEGDEAEAVEAMEEAFPTAERTEEAREKLDEMISRAEEIIDSLEGIDENLD
jgi:HEPN domain-containing protein